MARVDLSVIVPSRQEMFLKRTVEDLLKNMRGETEIIVGLDGAWADPPLDDHPKVHIIHHSKSIGQRAITNECAKYSKAKYLMKLDAHCCVAENFDVQMMADMQDNWTMVPLMKNFHVFNWICKKCGDIRYQGPTPTSCPKCDNTNDFYREIIWFAKNNPQSTAYCFDSEPHFQYFREFKNRPEGKGDITETMSLQGSCFMVTRDKYFELNLSDETFGSWGSQGIEVSVKTWLSGGRVVCNHKTWYGHLFRTQGLDFGFPYDISGRQVERAKKHARDLFYNNKFPKQILPSSWLLDRFWPIPGWSNEARAKVTEAGAMFMNLRNKVHGVLGVVSPIPSPVTDHAPPVSIDGAGQKMPVSAMGLSGLSGSSTISAKDILPIGDKSMVSGVATKSVVTDMIKNGDVFPLSIGNGADKPSVHKTVNPISDLVDSDTTITTAGSTTPNPAPIFFDSDLREKAVNGFRGRLVDNQHTGVGDFHNTTIPQNKPLSKGLVFYTDNRVSPDILNAVKIRLEASSNGHRLVTVSLKPLDFGENIVLNLRRGHLAMAKQQLAGLEALDTDIVFMVEHDCLYPACHFDFTPPRKDVFYYNLNWFKVRVSDGQALHFKAKQVSGLCAYRDILIEYFSNRVKGIESGEIGGRRHFEPGGRHYREEGYNKLTNHTFDTWFSEIPYVDIRHETTVTRNIFDPSGYRGQVTDWTMADEIKFWGRTKNNFPQFLAKVISGEVP